MELTRQDVDILIEAVDAWISKDFGVTVVTDVMEMVLSGQATEEQKVVMKEQKAKRAAEVTAKRKQREERAIVLKAKLLKLRDSITVEHLV